MHGVWTVEALRRRAQKNDDEEDLRAARERIDELLELFPDAPRVLFTAGNVAAAEGRTDLAEECFRWSIEAMPNYALPRYHLSMLARDRGDRDLEIELLKECLVFSPGHLDASHNLSSAYLHRARARADVGDILSAIDWAHRAVELANNDLESPFQLGEYLEAAGCLKEAAEVYERAIRGQSERTEGYVGLGRVLLLDGHPMRAFEALDQAVALDPTPGAHYLRGLCSVGMGRPWAALGDLEQAIAANASLAEVAARDDDWEPIRSHAEERYRVRFAELAGSATTTPVEPLAPVETTETAAPERE